MAVPTFTSITPDDGLPAGRGRVRIVGTGFRLPPVPPPAGSDPPLTGPIPGDFPQWLRTVRVEIDGRPCDDVIPVSDTLLYAITPEYRGLPASLPKLSDVVITNLDDSGVPIVGESVTASAAFTFRRQDLTVDSDVAWVARNVIDRFARNVIENVTVSTGLDYAESGSLLLAISRLPTLALLGPDIEEDEEGEERNERQFPQDPDAPAGDVLINAAPLPVSLVWRILVLSDDKLEALNLANLVTNDLRKRPRLVMESYEGSGVEFEFDLFLDEPMAHSDDFGDEVHGYESSLRLRGLLLDDTYGVEDGGVPIDGVLAPESGPDEPTLQIQKGLT